VDPIEQLAALNPALRFQTFMTGSAGDMIHVFFLVVTMAVGGDLVRVNCCKSKGGILEPHQMERFTRQAKSKLAYWAEDKIEGIVKRPQED